MIPGKLKITANLRASFLHKQLFPYVFIAVNKCIKITARENLSSVYIVHVLANNKCADEPAHPYSRLRKGEQKTDHL